MARSMLCAPPVVLSGFLAALTLAAAPDPAATGSAVASDRFAIRVVDAQTGRGVPLVELQTTNNILHYTDSNGLVAFLEPGLMGKEAYFHVKSHGYEYPKDGFGYRGVRLKCEPGGSATIKINRINIAERLYRVTGAGIYRDTVLLGRAAPTDEPVINGLVFGSDSVSTIEYRGRLFWLWGDTNWPAYPLGNFYTTCATSELPGRGGLDPDVGVNLHYFKRDNGFTKEMARFAQSGPTWLDGLVVLKEAGGEKLYASYANVNTKMETQERGLALYDDDKDVFEKIVVFPLDAPIHPGGHPFRHTVNGTDYVYFAHSLPFRRVPATAADLRNLDSYEAFTCLQPGTRVADGKIDRDEKGRIRYGWKKNTPPVSPQEERKLVEAGQLQADEALILLRDADSGKPVLAHAGSVYWNDYRRRWVFIVCEFFGTTVLGETWYAEADAPLGPWAYARKVVTHDTYSFYNPKQHADFAQDGGRIIYFEGTYTHTFSGNPVQTPRYDYNQIMYRLDLADPRLVLPVPVYCLSEPAEPQAFATAGDLPEKGKARLIAFFAPDRAAPGLVAVCRDHGEINSPTRSLTVKATDGDSAAGAGKNVLFYALPPDVKDPPAASVPLFEYTRESDGSKFWSAAENASVAGCRKSDRPLCRVWQSPTRLRYPLD